MEYKDFTYHVAQTANPPRWKWIVFLDATRTRTGRSLTRADAVLDAEQTIDNLLRSSERRSPVANWRRQSGLDT
jgi:hypothetical protein